MAPSDKDARYALWVLFGINLLNFFDRTLGSALAEPIRREFGLSDQQIGLASTAFIVAWAPPVTMTLPAAVTTMEAGPCSDVGVSW